MQKTDGWFLCMVGKLRISFEFVVVECVAPLGEQKIERQKGIRWMPWHQEAMKDVARCEKLWGTASRF